MIQKSPKKLLIDTKVGDINGFKIMLLLKLMRMSTYCFAVDIL